MVRMANIIHTTYMNINDSERGQNDLYLLLQSRLETD